MTNQTPPDGDKLLAAVADTATAVAAFTGVKRQYIDHGWSEPAAEQMVIAMLRSSVAAQEGRQP